MHICEGGEYRASVFFGQIWGLYITCTYQVGLLNVSETLRVGCTPEGFLGIYSHPWFAEIDWQVSSK